MNKSKALGGCTTMGAGEGDLYRATMGKISLLRR
jgi:hypothetical protein